MASKQQDLAKESRWREILKRCSGSGLSVRAFSHQEQLAKAMLYSWRWMIHQRDSNRKAASQTPGFVPAVVIYFPSSDMSIAIELGGAVVCCDCHHPCTASDPGVPDKTPLVADLLRVG